jgi:hypothetical protein
MAFRVGTSHTLGGLRYAAIQYEIMAVRNFTVYQICKTNFVITSILTPYNL